MWRLLISLVLCAGPCAASGPRVETSAGTVEGVQLEGVHQFLNMPFATSRRFEPPVDFIGKYKAKVRDGSVFGNACMQVGDNPSIAYGSESDCLVANIWKPAGATVKDKLPVLCFIYGGSWQFGETEPYNGSAIAQTHNTIYASLAYRTGPIGFMAFGEDAASKKTTGNWGMLDMQAGLRWLRREVANFGGDPNRITIHGQSSGGQAVELHYVMPQSNGLLRGIISESGGLGASSLSRQLKSTLAAANATGCLDARDSQKANKTCMQLLPPVSITELTYELNFGPTIDGVAIPADPSELLATGHINSGISVIFGSNTNDSNRDMLPQYEDRHGNILPLSVQNYTAAVREEVGMKHLAAVLAVYPPHTEQRFLSQNVNRLGSISSDQMLCSVRRRLSLFNRARPGQAWMYRFNYFYQSNPACVAEPNYHSKMWGSVHEDEVTFVMGQPIFMFDGSCCGVFGDHTSPKEGCPMQKECTACYAPGLFNRTNPYFNDKEGQFAKFVGKLWTNFASSQNPNVRIDHRGEVMGAALDSIIWPEPSSAGGAIMHNIVLDGDLDVFYKIESTVYDDSRICGLWDMIEGDHQ